jgi:hypothetical protein
MARRAERTQACGSKGLTRQFMNVADATTVTAANPSQ